jgi:hypothetical protein
LSVITRFMEGWDVITEASIELSKYATHFNKTFFIIGSMYSMFELVKYLVRTIRIRGLRGAQRRYPVFDRYGRGLDQPVGYRCL